MDNLSTIVMLLVALSVASERLVEIIKGLIPALSQENPDPTKESWRKAALQVLAVIAGIITAGLAQPAIKNQGLGSWSDGPGIVALGLLASGGSGFWNAILTYVKQVKDIKELQVEEKKEAKKKV